MRPKFLQSYRYYISPDQKTPGAWNEMGAQIVWRLSTTEFDVVVMVICMPYTNQLLRSRAEIKSNKIIDAKIFNYLWTGGATSVRFW